MQTLPRRIDGARAMPLTRRYPLFMVADHMPTRCHYMVRPRAEPKPVCVLQVKERKKVQRIMEWRTMFVGQYWTSNPGARPADMCDALLEAFAAEAEFSDVDVQPSEHQWPSDDDSSEGGGDDDDGDGDDGDDVGSRSYSTTPLVEPTVLVPSTQPNEDGTAVDDGGSSEQRVEGTPPPSPRSEHKGSEAATSSTKKSGTRLKICPHCGQYGASRNFARHEKRCLNALATGKALQKGGYAPKR